MNFERVAKNIYTVCCARGWTKEEFAKRTRLEVPDIFRHIKSGNIPLADLANIAESLGCGIGDLTDSEIDPARFSLSRDILFTYPYNLIATAACGTVTRTDTAGTSEAIAVVSATHIPSFLKAVQELDDCEQEILKLRYRSGMTTNRIGSRLGLSRKNVIRIEYEALEKLRAQDVWHRCRMVRMDDANRLLNKCRELEMRLKETKKQLAALEANREAGKGNNETEIPPAPPEAGNAVREKKVHIDNLDFSTRAYNCLFRCGIHYVDDLCNFTADDLLNTRNLGAGTLAEIVRKIEPFGVKLKDDDAAYEQG